MTNEEVLDNFLNNTPESQPTPTPIPSSGNVKPASNANEAILDQFLGNAQNPPIAQSNVPSPAEQTGLMGAIQKAINEPSSASKSYQEAVVEPLKTATESAFSALGEDALIKAAQPVRQWAAAHNFNPDTFAPDINDVYRRRAANPWAAFLGSGIGASAIGGFVGGLGEGLLGQPITNALNNQLTRLALPATAARLGAQSLTGGIEGAAIGGAQALSDKLAGDPEPIGQKLLANIGIGAGLGIGFPLIGSALGKAGERLGIIKNPNPNISAAIKSEIEKINDQPIDLKPDDIPSINPNKELTLPGEEPKKPTVDQKTVDIMNNLGFDNPPDSLLLNDPNLRNQAASMMGKEKGMFRVYMYNKAKEIADRMALIVKSMVPDSGAASLNDFGNQVQTFLRNKYEGFSNYFNDAYGRLRSFTGEMFHTDQQMAGAQDAIRNLTDKLGLGKSDPAYELALNIADEIEDRKNVPKVRDYLTSLQGRNLESRNEKAVRSAAADILSRLNNNTLLKYSTQLRDNILSRTMLPKNHPQYLSPTEAESIWGPQIDELTSIPDRLKNIDSEYAKFKKNTRTLFDIAGLDEPQGPQHAMHLITNELQPEQLVKNLTNTKYANQIKFLAQEQPELFQMLRAFKQEELFHQFYDPVPRPDSNDFNLQKYLDSIFGKRGLSKEAREFYFDPDQLKQLEDIYYITKRYPKTFDWSSAKQMSYWTGLKESAPGFLFLKPWSWAAWATGEHLLDAARLAKFSGYKMGGEFADNLGPTLDHFQDTANKFLNLNAVINMSNMSDRRIADGIKGVFIGGPLVSHPEDQHATYDQKVNKIQELADPDAMDQHLNSQMGDHKDYLPNVTQAMSGHLNRAAQYLNAQIPKPPSIFAANPDWEPPEPQKEHFESVYKAVNDPIGILDDLKTGEITQSQVNAIAATSPQLLQEMRTKMGSYLHPETFKLLPAWKKNALSIFMGVPLDQSQYQPVMMYNQMQLMGAQAQKQAQQRSTVGGLKELSGSKRAKTALQGSEE